MQMTWRFQQILWPKKLVYMGADKKEYMYFNRERAISTLNSVTLELADKFTYLDSRVLSTQSAVKIH